MGRPVQQHRGGSDEPEAFGFFLGLDSPAIDLCRTVEGTRIAQPMLHAIQ
jgi:hypothetical protein